MAALGVTDVPVSTTDKAISVTTIQSTAGATIEVDDTNRQAVGPRGSSTDTGSRGGAAGFGGGAVCTCTGHIHSLVITVQLTLRLYSRDRWRRRQQQQQQWHLAGHQAIQQEYRYRGCTHTDAPTNAYVLQI